MKNLRIVCFIVSIASAVIALIALIVSIVALVKSCTRRNITTDEYNCFDDDSDDDESIGSDTLAF
ncbi:MAG: hypothetical protein J1E40_03935 [Oscillospiraceae bacterium]|nr:hypothetical protein [Oscillospiraceae bacterium]